MMKKFYASAWSISLAYSVAILLLWLGALTHTIYPLYAAVAFFTLWDVMFFLAGRLDRNAQETTESATRARTYVSYLVVLYGGMIIYFIQKLGTTEAEALTNSLQMAGIPLWLVLAPLGLWGVSLLFFPITLGDEHKRALNERNATSANLAVFFICSWSQKVGTYTLVFCLTLLAISSAGITLAPTQ